MCRIGFHLNLINSLIFSSKAGVSKLTDAKALVDDLKQKAGEQSQQLAEKQAEADAALREITASMQVNNQSYFTSVQLTIYLSNVFEYIETLVIAWLFLPFSVYCKCDILAHYLPFFVT